MGKKYFYLFSVLALFCLDTKAQSTNYDLNGDGDIDVADVEVLIDAIKNEQSYDYVDLGLPSGVLWAATNVGADSPEEYGDHFAWGETTPQSDNTYSWDSYKWCKGSSTTFTKYCNDSSYGYNGFTDTKTVLDAEDDAARANWGNGWRMPTYAEFEELIYNTTSVWTTQNGVNGRKFTSTTNGNSIFFPAAGYRWDDKLYGAGSYGYYWSSSLCESGPDGARGLDFYSGYVNASSYGRRDYGQSVRPVRFVSNYDLNGDGAIDVADVEVLIDAIKDAFENANKSHAHVDLGLPSGLLWATMNVGAESPEDYGDYFAWGETTPQSDNTYSWASYKWCNGSGTTFTKYSLTDSKIVLDAEDDAARANWGGDWRMPTSAEFEELINNTTSEWTTQNGVKGRKFTSTTNGKSIFLPAAGYRWGDDSHDADCGPFLLLTKDMQISDAGSSGIGDIDEGIPTIGTGSNGNYWSSSLYESYPYYARGLYFSSDGVYTSYRGRACGQPVRPVRQN